MGVIGYFIFFLGLCDLCFFIVGYVVFIRRFDVCVSMCGKFM